MAVAVDASSPALVSHLATTSVVTTASFTPPAGSVLVAAIVSDAPDVNGGGGLRSYTMSNSGTALTWTSIVVQDDGVKGGYAALYWATQPTSTSMTVTATEGGANNNGAALKVYVLTGADTTTPVAVSSSKSWSGTAATSLALTNGSRANGLYIGAATDWNSTGTPTSANLSPLYGGTITSLVSYGIGSEAATAATTAYTGTFTFPATSQGQQVGAIIQPSSGSAFSGSVTLSGSGTLSFAGTPKPTGTLTLSGSGTLVETGSPAPTGTLTLSGSGTLTTSATITTSGTLALSGSGSLSLLPPTIASGTLTLAGSGTLTLSGVPGFSFVLSMVSFTSTGTLTLSGTPAMADVLPLSGQGVLQLSGQGYLWKFTSPSFLEWRPFQLTPPVRLQYAIPYGYTVWRDSTGAWQQKYAPSLDDLAGVSTAYPGGPATVVYGGGRKWPLTDQQRADLTAAGYAANIILEPIQ